MGKVCVCVCGGCVVCLSLLKSGLGARASLLSGGPGPSQGGLFVQTLLLGGQAVGLNDPAIGGFLSYGLLPIVCGGPRANVAWK